MGLIATITEFFREPKNGVEAPFLKVEAEKGVNFTVPHFTPPGDDSPPLPIDQAALAASTGEGRFNAVGYLDNVNAGIANPGEKRFIARDADGAIKATLYMQNDGGFSIIADNYEISALADGTIKVANSSGSFDMAAGGNINLNGVTIDTAGNITSPSKITGDSGEFSSSLIAAGKELVAHDHAITGGSSAPGPTGPNN
jgi:hypothetical protein